ncbi:MAG: zinc ABC transporter substrate-binding protein, partial [Clostridiales bacterium]|nr:zinc ABC transporter substrate-binding protein [Clostridiales bacterium]
AALLLITLAVAPAWAQPQKKWNVVATTFPAWDWLRQVLGADAEQVNLVLLQESGADLHNFQPSVQDIVTVSTADLFVYIGGPSDNWVKDALAQATNPDMQVVNLMETLGEDVKVEVSVEGMQAGAHAHDDDDHDHEAEVHDEHDHEAEAHGEHEHEAETHNDHQHEAEVHGDHEHDHDHGDETTHAHSHNDEHIWLSLTNAQKLTQALADALSRLDAQRGSVWQQNARQYIEELARLDQQYHKALDPLPDKTLLFGDRFPFRYLMDDYGIRYYAAFSGCSAESEASFETVAFLAGKVNELNLPVVLTIDGSDGRIAQAVVSASGTTPGVDTLNAMQTITRQDIEAGASYLHIMQQNLQVLEKALKP